MEGSFEGQGMRETYRVYAILDRDCRGLTAEFCIDDRESAKAAVGARTEEGLGKIRKSILCNGLYNVFHVCPTLARFLHWHWRTEAEVVAGFLCLHPSLIFSQSS